MSDTWLQNYSAAALPPSTGGKIHADNGHLVAFRPSIRMHQMISGHQQSARLSPPSLSMCHGCRTRLYLFEHLIRSQGICRHAACPSPPSRFGQSCGVKAQRGLWTGSPFHGFRYRCS